MKEQTHLASTDLEWRAEAVSVLKQSTNSNAKA